MRWLLAAAMFLGGCSSDATPAANEPVKTCANTSCVPGASCITNDGTPCTCFRAGEWTCGDVPRDPGDGGFSVDVEAIPTPDAEPPPDPGYSSSRELTGCGTTDACSGEDPVEGAKTALSIIGQGCRTCALITLYAGADGCPVRVSANRDLTATVMECLAKGITNRRWSCAETFQVAPPCGE